MKNQQNNYSVFRKGKLNWARKSFSQSVLMHGKIAIIHRNSKITIFSFNIKKNILSFLNTNFSNKTFIFVFFSLNLYELIKKNNYQGFSLSLIRRFCNSIVKCLRLLFKENIIHCDLKPVSLSIFLLATFSFSIFVFRKIYF